MTSAERFGMAPADGAAITPVGGDGTDAVVGDISA
jgi:hypothetical protein